jgi:phage gp37-like protein
MTVPSLWHCTVSSDISKGYSASDVICKSRITSIRKYDWMDNLCIKSLQILMAVQSKAWVFGRSLAGTAGSNPATGKEVSLL